MAGYERLINNRVTGIGQHGIAACLQFLDTDALSLAEARLATVETIARSAVEHKGDAVLRVLGEGFVAQME